MCIILYSTHIYSYIIYYYIYTHIYSLYHIYTKIITIYCILNYTIGVSFGLTSQLLNFWTKKGFQTCYIRQTINDLTGEYSCILLKELNYDVIHNNIHTNNTHASSNNTTNSSSKSKGHSSDDYYTPNPGWVEAYVTDYRRRLVSLMNYSFNTIEIPLAITLVDPDRRLTTSSSSSSSAALSSLASPNTTPANIMTDTELTITENPTPTPTTTNTTTTDNTSSSLTTQFSPPLTATELLSIHLSHHDMKRLELYARNMVDHHMILDCIPTLARLIFLSRIPTLHFTYLQIGK